MVYTFLVGFGDGVKVGLFVGAGVDVSTCFVTSGFFCFCASSPRPFIKTTKKETKRARRHRVKSLRAALAVSHSVKLPTSFPSIANANSVPLYAGVHSVSSTWTSSGITWSNKPSTGTNAEDFNMMTSAGWYKWDVTNLARGWYETGNNTGMMFRTSDGAESEDTGDWAQFYASDYGSYSPTLTIEYRNTSGLEDYWDYFSASAGRAGTGYVNAASGNLVWVRDLMGFDGNRMPVSISTIYNASERNANTFCMGYGWRTNFHQRILTSSDYYVWEDADGTKHFFAENDDGDYVDEDGLDLTLTFGSGTTSYCITDIYGNKSYFDAGGQLKKIQNNQATPSSITIAYYTTGMISTITDGVGREYTFV